MSQLVNELSSNKRTVVITTIQKLDRLMKNYEKNPENPKLQKIRNKVIAFVVDEAHRAVTPQKQDELNRFFNYTFWYGFTGTPLFEENARDEFADLPRTTEEQYGECLHQYTVKEAINDGAVLGFQIEHKNTIPDYDIDDVISQTNPGVDVNALSPLEKEDLLPGEIYRSMDHYRNVVYSIVNSAINKFKLGTGLGNSLEAMLSVTSIDEAIIYYHLFKEIKVSDDPLFSINRKVRERQQDFPKVGITFSVSDNQEKSIDHQDAMKEILADYNEMFQTNFSLETLNLYNNDLNSRLARKQEKFKNREEQLDLVIVVDRLLTGFDAPAMAVLFMDRPPIKPHHLIQAFSRMNRIFDVKRKPYGQVVTYRLPVHYEEAVERAFFLYSNGGERYIQAPTWEESLEKFEEAMGEFQSLISSPTDMQGLSELYEMKKKAKVFQNFDKTYGVIRIYSNYEEDYAEGEFEARYGVPVEQLEDYYGAYNNLMEEIKEQLTTVEDDEEVNFDIEYEIHSISRNEIDYNYLLNLIDKYKHQQQEKATAEANVMKTKVTHLID